MALVVPFGDISKDIKVACDLHSRPEASLVINWMHLRLLYLKIDNKFDLLDMHFGCFW